jgi:hypothetical protein
MIYVIWDYVTYRLYLSHCHSFAKDFGYEVTLNDRYTEMSALYTVPLWKGFCKLLFAILQMQIIWYGYRDNHIAGTILQNSLHIKTFKENCTGNLSDTYVT